MPGRLTSSTTKWRRLAGYWKTACFAISVHAFAIPCLIYGKLSPHLSRVGAEYSARLNRWVINSNDLGKSISRLLNAISIASGVSSVIDSETFENRSGKFTLTQVIGSHESSSTSIPSSSSGKSTAMQFQLILKPPLLNSAKRNWLFAAGQSERLLNVNDYYSATSWSHVVPERTNQIA